MNLTSRNTWIAFLVTSIPFLVFFVYPHLERTNIWVGGLTLIAGIGAAFSLLVAATLPLFILIIGYNYLRRGVLGSKEIEINREAVIENDGHRVRKVLWAEVKGVYKTRSHIFVRIPGLKYIIVPARDFDNEYDFVKYYADLIKFRGGCS